MLIFYNRSPFVLALQHQLDSLLQIIQGNFIRQIGKAGQLSIVSQIVPDSLSFVHGTVL